MEAEQLKVRNLLLDTITMLCKSGLTHNQLKIEGVIAVTVNEKDVFVVHIDDRTKKDSTLQLSHSSERPQSAFARAKRTVCDTELSPITKLIEVTEQADNSSPPKDNTFHFSVEKDMKRKESETLNSRSNNSDQNNEYKNLLCVFPKLEPPDCMEADILEANIKRPRPDLPLIPVDDPYLMPNLITVAPADNSDLQSDLYGSTDYNSTPSSEQQRQFYGDGLDGSADAMPIKPVPQDVVQELFENRKSSANFAAKLSDEYYTEEERLRRCCVRGRNRTPSISPTGRRLKLILKQTYEMCNVPPDQRAQLEADIVQNIDSRNRRARKRAEKKRNSLVPM